LEHIQPMQRFGQDGASVRDPYFGATGFRFKNANVMIDDYFPSAFGAPYSSSTNGGLGNNLTAAFTNPIAASATGDGKNNWPDSTDAANITPGEVLCMFNTSRIKFRVTNSREFGFNPTDFIRTPDNTRVASQLKAAVNLEFMAPWSSVQGFGWNS